MLKLAITLSDIKGIPPRFLKNLANLKIFAVNDLLRHFPVRYEDFSEISPIAELEPGQPAVVQGIIQKIDIRRSWHRRMVIVEAIIRDDSGSIRAVWFNQPYLLTVLRPGRLANFAGKVAISEENELYLSHPAYEIIAKSETRHTGRLVPIYPETRGLTSKGIRFLVQPILKNLEQLAEWLPAEILRANNFPEINQALNDIHFPQTIEAALLAKKRFVFEDLFLLQLSNLRQKLKLAREKAPAVKTEIEHLKEIIAELPFELTLSQKRSFWEIIQDIEKPAPMNRLLQGDVGSGKTVVAALTTLIAADNGFQSAFMAPTEILAHQHFQTLKKIFAGLPLKKQPEIGLLTSKNAKIFYENDLESGISKPEFKKKIESGVLKVIVGTHALIQRDIDFKNLGVVIVDEQHRFGVAQRAQLMRGKKILPHLLSMSATPIPRTLMLTIFGDLDLSTIDELPKGRKSIITKIVAPANRDKAYAFIRGQVKKGRQVFVICPRIEKIEANGRENGNIREISRNNSRQFAFSETKAVKEEYEKLSKKIFPDLKVAMLHGQLKSKEKEKIMNGFKAGKIEILVSTSVVEVGVDVPNATIMLIEGAERFGLAQLYQFRGRVGRGEHQSFCFLFTESNSKTTQERLKAILEAKNGFELAEKDLAIRGPGEFLGQKQTGLPDVAMKGLQDAELIKVSRQSAVHALQNDPELNSHPLLKEKLTEFSRQLHLE